MNEAMQAAIEHGIREYPNEACGFIVMEAGQEAYIPCENRSLNPTKMFTLDGQDYLDAAARGRTVAIVHTHPDGSSAPSDADRRACEMSGHPWRILAIHKDLEEIKYMGESSLEPCGYVVPLIGREFVHGVLDCFTLLRDYYRMRLNIELPNFSREDDWWRNGQNLYVDNYMKANFVPAPTGVQEHDVVLMQVRSRVPNHAGIYVGNTRILHHLYGQLSREDLYNGYWQEVTTHILRHKDLL